ncbi:sirohydrochlorin chelatase [Spirulina sp. CS-785/01]|uniref:sirohydrochlorin chelatase n=1 Tax=Spirulina sp. CS-785/01 TaxID=3021716 RepID=UPI00232DD62A|nr:sirohydrochlorin chelatase [Spirulina sp. CS-785/01]MDB9312665.1 sirohydrochlorin chelatase [Spirulina sp. CS-785/01]
MEFAYFLVWHGSRDRRSQTASHHLAYLVTQALGLSPSLVGVAPLELSPYPLHEALVQFAQQVQGTGVETIRILPLFLLPGVHVKEDIPAEIAQARQQLGSSPQLELLDYLGKQPQMVDLLAQEFQDVPQNSHSQRILLSHGSRREGANCAIAALAAQLNARPAYWAVPPHLSSQIEHCVTNGQTDIAIQPYFLFTGGLTDAIAQQVAELRVKFADAKLNLGEPLGATPQLAQLITDKLHE